MAACQAVTPPTAPPPTPDPGLLEGNAWPPLPEDLGLTAEARRLCLPDLGVPAGIRVAFQDRRELGRAVVYFANDQTVAWCSMLRTAEGTTLDGGSGAQDMWTPDIGFATTASGLGIQSVTVAADASGWSIASGLLPRGATTVRVVVDGQAIHGVVGAGIYSVSWPGPGVPIVMVAHDAAGNEVGRLTESALRPAFEACDPGTGCLPPR